MTACSAMRPTSPSPSCRRAVPPTARAARPRGARRRLGRLGRIASRERPGADVLLLVGDARGLLPSLVGRAGRRDGGRVPVEERRAVSVPVRLPGYVKPRLRTDEGGERLRTGA